MKGDAEQEELRLIHEQLDQWKIPRRAPTGGRAFDALARIRAMRNRDLEVLHVMKGRIDRLERLLEAYEPDASDMADATWKGGHPA